MKRYDPGATMPLLPLTLWAPGPKLLRGLPAALRGWLTEPGLLTDRIRAESGAPPAVRVVAERLGFLSSEQQALLEAPAASCFVREVELVGGGRSWVYAQSLVPDHTLELHPWLAALGDSSLGATLEAVPGVERGPFEYAALPLSHPLAAAALAAASWRAPHAPQVLWARRSWFALRCRRLLVQELFLAASEQC